MSGRRKPCCGRCKHPGFMVSYDTVDGRPRFKCDKCGDTWTCGHSGGDFIEHVMNQQDVLKKG